MCLRTYVCVSVCVHESDPGPSVLSAVGAVLHISHMTAPNLALPDRTGLTSHARTHTHNTRSKVPCVLMDGHQYQIHTFAHGNHLEFIYLFILWGGIHTYTHTPTLTH